MHGFDPARARGCRGMNCRNRSVGHLQSFALQNDVGHAFRNYEFRHLSDGSQFMRGRVGGFTWTSSRISIHHGREKQAAPSEQTRDVPYSPTAMVLRWLAPILASRRRAWTFFRRSRGIRVLTTWRISSRPGAERDSPLDWRRIIALRPRLVRETEGCARRGEIGAPLEPK